MKLVKLGKKNLTDIPEREGERGKKKFVLF